LISIRFVSGVSIQQFSAPVNGTKDPALRMVGAASAASARWKNQPRLAETALLAHCHQPTTRRDLSRMGMRTLRNVGLTRAQSPPSFAGRAVHRIEIGEAAGKR